MSDLAQFDTWLTTDNFAALVIREYLEPVEGPDGVLFPATYAAAEDKKVFPGGYNIDPPEGDKNVCLVDSVGSQANRIEPMFAKPDYAHLVPQIAVKAGEKSVSILEAGHRAGDALVRCTPLQKQLQDAFKAVLKGDAEPLARVAPTSLVFGVWDSRDTQAKLPRLVASTIRAFDVKRLKRSAQFNPATDYIGSKLLEETADKKLKDAYAERGFVHVPATGSHGGVIATGEIRRDATLSLAALRLLAGGDAKKTLELRRYILGLSLVSFLSNSSTYLRQGCNLVPSEKPRVFNLVHSDGKRDSQKLTLADALKYATAVAKAFDVKKGEEVVFDPKLAQADIKGEGSAQTTRTTRARRGAAATDATDAAGGTT
ncbi:MAG: type I-U CRISPR-associated protein Cas7 [Planctomycetaceae bacterium]|nr:type I-U CRISPR-associated protein Cas7 [Planctomycetaceae bacterium]